MSINISPVFINGDFVFNDYNFKLDYNNINNHYDQNNLNIGNYKHLTEDQYNKATNYTSSTSDGILKKEDY